MVRRILTLLAVVGVCSFSAMADDQSHQSALSPDKAEAAKTFPQIVVYSVAWCPHCKEAKDYLTRNNIPFTNRDVEIDAKAMEELTEKYNSHGVPVIVIGSGKDEVVVKGFTPELFQESLKKARSRK